MNLKQTAQIVKLLQVAYPSMVVFPPSKDEPGTIDFWFSALQSVDLEDCQAAVEHFRMHDSGRQFAPGLFEFEAAARKVVEDRNARQRAASDVKRVTHNSGETSETYRKEVGGQVREFIRVTKAERQRIHAEEIARGMVKETYQLPNGSIGYRYTPDTSGGPSASRSLAEMLDGLAKPMPKPEPEDYSERYEWGSVWGTMDAAAAMPMQDNTPIGPADFKRRND